MTGLAVESKHDAIRSLLRPSSIAVVGASPRGGYGGRFWENARRAAPSVDVYPVNPGYDEIDGVRCYPRLEELPIAPDLIAIIVRQAAVLDVLRQGVEVGAKSAVVISAGFAERDDEGRRLQEELTQLARSSGLRLVGPNCLGLANVASGLWATSSSVAIEYADRLRVGPVAIVSQSGATAFGTLVPRAAEMGLGLSAVVSTGNEADLDFADIAGYLVAEGAVRVIAGYVEGLRDPAKFVAVADAAAEKGIPIVVAKTGRSEQGARAALSHTASLTGSDRTYDGLFEQHGVIRASSFDEVLATAQLLSTTPPPKARGVALLSHSGGVSAMTADILGTKGVVLPLLSTEAEADLARVLDGVGTPANPGDLSQAIRGDRFPEILAVYADEEAIGTVVVANRGNDAQADALIRARDERDEAFVYLWTSGHESPTLQKLRDAGIPVFLSEAFLAEALASRMRYYDWLSRRLPAGPPRPLEPGQADAVRRALDAGRPVLSEHEAKSVLSAWGLPATREFLVRSADEAAARARELGFPVVVKVDSWQIPHKSELGLVRLNLTSEDDVASAYEEVAHAAAAHATEFGVLVQEQVSDAVELIVGVSMDEQLGPALLFGVGGVNVEIYDDVVTRICPISPVDAREMVDAIRASRLVYGYRGTSARDVDALEAALVAVSELACAFGGELESLDVNPLFLLEAGRGVVAGDALLQLKARP